MDSKIRFLPIIFNRIANYLKNHFLRLLFIFRKKISYNIVKITYNKVKKSCNIVKLYHFFYRE